MRFLAALFLCLLVPTYVAAKPSPYPVDSFSGDRYVRLAQSAPDVLRAKECGPPFGCKNPTTPRWGTPKRPKVKYLYRTKPRQKGAPVPARRLAPAHLTLAQGFKREITTAATPFIRGRLICAANVGAELARRGQRGTGSRLAMSYRNWGRASGPVSGAVAVFGRRGGGHVAIVHSVTPSGQVIYLNPSSRRQAWMIGPYRRQPIAFRVAS